MNTFNHSKLLAIISFFMICALTPTGFPILITLILGIIEFFQSVTISGSPIFYEGLLIIPLVGILYAFYKSKNIAISTICFIALFVAALSLTNALNFNIEDIKNLWFTVPFVLFIIFAIISLIIS